MVDFLLALVALAAVSGTVFGLVNVVYPIERLGVSDRSRGVRIALVSYLLLVAVSVVFPDDFEWPWAG